MPTPRQAALGTAGVFTASGALLGGWVARLPAVRDHLHATPGQLGTALLAVGIGSLTSMPLTGKVVRRFGSRAVVAVDATAACATLAVIGRVGTLTQLTVALFFLGLFYGSWDVGMNVQGSTVDQLAGKGWMPRYHACWSVGSILGTAVGALAARFSVGVGTHFLVAAIGCLILCAAGLTLHVDDRTAAVPKADRKRGGVLTRRLLLIGVVVLVATTIEGAASDWLAIFLADARHVSEAAAALGFTVFATAMTIGRFLGTPVTERLGRAVAVRISGLLAIAGVLLAIFSPVLILGYAGALLWGAGVCLVFPAGISAAGESPRPAESIATVSTLGYGAILLGPPLIGALADHVGLGNALLVLVVLGAIVAVLAPATAVPHSDRSIPLVSAVAAPAASASSAASSSASVSSSGPSSASASSSASVSPAAASPASALPSASPASASSEELR